MITRISSSIIEKGYESKSPARKEGKEERARTISTLFHKSNIQMRVGGHCVSYYCDCASFTPITNDTIPSIKKKSSLPNEMKLFGFVLGFRMLPTVNFDYIEEKLNLFIKNSSNGIKHLPGPSPS